MVRSSMWMEACWRFSEARDPNGYELSPSSATGGNSMRGVIIHAPKDLRVEKITLVPLGPHDVRVRIESGGICGSDLHYYHHGGFGTVRLKEPMALGHEIAGTIDEVGSEVSRVSPGV